MNESEVRISFTLRISGPGCSTTHEMIRQRIAEIIEMELPASCSLASLDEALNFEIAPIPPREGA